MKSKRYRMNHLYRIMDYTGKECTFEYNRAQRLLHAGLHYYNVILKSRQHGITTFFCLWALDECIFVPKTQALIVAHNLPDAEEFFFNKIKFAYDGLHDSLKAIAGSTRESSRQLRFANKSSIRVATSGRSGTYQMVHISEFGKICAENPIKAREIITGTLNAVHPGMIVSIESTAEGREGRYFDLCQQSQKLQQQKAKLTPLDPKFFFFGWHTNAINRLPDADFPYMDYQQEYFDKIKNVYGLKLSKEQLDWYAKKWNQQGEDMRREHPSTPAEAFESALEGVYYEQQFKKVREEKRICSVPYQDGALVNTWWDIGYNDINSIWFTQDIGREIHVINYYQNSGEGLKFYIDILNEKKTKLHYRYGTHHAPHDITVHEYTTGERRIDSAKKMGLKFKVVKKTGVQSGIEKVRQILKICWFDEAKTATGMKTLESYRKQWDEINGTYKKKPLHDWTSNGADAFRTMAVGHKFGTDSTINSGERRDRQKKKANPKGWT
jgi:hypothetical protein